MEKNRIVAIVVTYNRKDLLKECIEALNKNENLDVLVIDNASTDGTKELVEKYVSDTLKYVNTGNNLGGAGGFNFGIKEALKNKNYKYLWIMDDDTIVQEDSLDNLVKKAEELNNDFSFLSSIALWKDGSLCKMNIQKLSEKSLEQYKLMEKGVVFVDYASFVSCFINVESIKKVGLPIKDFFIYGDDMEYTMRLNTYKPGFVVSTSVVIHKMKENDGINIIDADKTRIDRYFYNFRNLLYIYKKYDKREYRNYKIKCYYMMAKILFRAPNSKLKRIKTILKAMKKAKKFNPEIEKLIKGN